MNIDADAERLKKNIRRRMLDDVLTMGEAAGPVNDYDRGYHLGKQAAYNQVLEWLNPREYPV